MPMASSTPYIEDRLTFLPFDHPQFRRPVGLVRRKDATMSAVEREFLTTLERNGP